MRELAQTAANCGATVTELTTRSEARQQNCPVCGAGPGEDCRGARGPRAAVHRERMRRAAEVTGRPAALTLSLGAGGQLVDASGKVLGSLVGLEIDVPEGEGGEPTEGGAGEAVVDVVSVLEGSSSSEGLQGEPLSLMPTPEKEVWEHYVATVAGANRRVFDNRRKNLVKRALKVRSVDECKRAITALSLSTWHNGSNPQSKKYLDVEYALGKSSQSPDEIIDRWLEQIGDGHGPTAVDRKLAEMSEGRRLRVREDMNRVRRMYRQPEHDATVRNGRQSADRLREEYGIVAAEDENGHFVRWETV